MEIKTISVGWNATNCYIIFDRNTCEASVIDPGGDAERILDFINKNNLKVKNIFLTHGHFDHTTSVDTVREAYKVSAYIHSHDAVMLEDAHKSAFYTFFHKECIHRKAERMLADGDVIPLGEESIKVIHTPGHSGGSVCFLCGDILVSGDTLFSNSVGRTDLWSGNTASLLSSLDRLASLEGPITIYPGHGEPSTLAEALENAKFFF